MNDKPDPILKRAINEIVAICDKYDIGGHIVLASKTNGEYILYFPKWSKAQFEDFGEPGKLLRIKAEGKKDHEDLTATIHMIQVFEIQGFNIYRGMGQMLESLENKIIITGEPKSIK